MNRRLAELHIERGKLLERITTQRYFLARAAVPVEEALGRVDGVVERVGSAARYVRQHPGLIAAGLGGLLLLLRKERSLRWARRGFLLWQTLRAVGNRLAFLRTRS